MSIGISPTTFYAREHILGGQLCPGREPSLGLGANQSHHPSPGLFVAFFFGEDIGVIGNRLIMLCWMRGVLVDENTAHKSS
jgi:hypothetical protein